MSYCPRCDLLNGLHFPGCPDQPDGRIVFGSPVDSGSALLAIYVEGPTDGLGDLVEVVGILVAVLQDSCDERVTLPPIGSPVGCRTGDLIPARDLVDAA